MSMNSLTLFEFKTQIVKALANPLRLAICEYLLEQQKPKCVNHIAKHFEQNQSTISKHLSILQKEGVIAVEKQANYVRYFIQNKVALQCFIDAVNGLLENKTKQHSSVLESLKS
jgi:DNA-binding transcriptional ArsR family regulator